MWAYPDKLAPESFVRRPESPIRAVAKFIETAIENNGHITRSRIVVKAIAAILRNHESWLKTNDVTCTIAENYSEALIVFPNGQALRYFDITAAPRSRTNYREEAIERFGVVHKQVLRAAPGAQQKSVREIERERMAKDAAGRKYRAALQRLQKADASVSSARREHERISHKYFTSYTAKLRKLRQVGGLIGARNVRVDGVLAELDGIDWRPCRPAVNAANPERLEYVLLSATEIALRLERIAEDRGRGSLGVRMKEIADGLRSILRRRGRSAILDARVSSYAAALKKISRMGRPVDGEPRDYWPEGSPDMTGLNTRRELFGLSEKLDALATEVSRLQYVQGQLLLGAAIVPDKIRSACVVGLIAFIPVLITIVLHSLHFSSLIGGLYVITMSGLPLLIAHDIEDSLSFRRARKDHGIIPPFEKAEKIRLLDMLPDKSAREDAKGKFSYFSYFIEEMIEGGEMAEIKNPLFADKDALGRTYQFTQWVAYLHEWIHGNRLFGKKLRVRIEAAAVPLTFCIPCAAVLLVILVSTGFLLSAFDVAFLASLLAYTAAFPYIAGVVARQYGVVESPAGHRLIGANIHQHLSDEEIDGAIEDYAHAVTMDEDLDMKGWQEWLRGNDGTANAVLIRSSDRPEDILVIKSSYAAGDGHDIDVLKDAIESSDKRSLILIIADDGPGGDTIEQRRERVRLIVRDAERALKEARAQGAVPARILKKDVRSTAYDLTSLRGMLSFDRRRLDRIRAGDLERELVFSEVHGHIDNLKAALEWAEKNTFRTAQLMGDYIGHATDEYGLEAIDMIREHMDSEKMPRGKIPRLKMLLGRTEHVFLRAMMGDEKWTDRWLSSVRFGGVQVKRSLQDLAKKEIRPDMPERLRSDIEEAQDFEYFLEEIAMKENISMDEAWQKWYRFHPKLLGLIEFMIDNAAFAYSEDSHYNLYLLGAIPEDLTWRGLKGREALRAMEKDYKAKTRLGLWILILMKEIWGHMYLAPAEINGYKEELMNRVRRIIQREREINKTARSDDAEAAEFPAKKEHILNDIQAAIAADPANNDVGMIFKQLDDKLKESTRPIPKVFDQAFELRSIGMTDEPGGLETKDGTAEARTKRRIELGINTVISSSDGPNGCFTKGLQRLGQVRVVNRDGSIVLVSVDALKEGRYEPEPVLKAKTKKDEAGSEGQGQSLESRTRRKLKALEEAVDDCEDLAGSIRDTALTRYFNTAKYILSMPLFAREDKRKIVKLKEWAAGLDRELSALRILWHKGPYPLGPVDRAAIIQQIKKVETAGDKAVSLRLSHDEKMVVLHEIKSLATFITLIRGGIDILESRHVELMKQIDDWLMRIKKFEKFKKIVAHKKGGSIFLDWGASMGLPDESGQIARGDAKWLAQMLAAGSPQKLSPASFRNQYSKRIKSIQKRVSGSKLSDTLKKKLSGHIKEVWKMDVVKFSAIVVSAVENENVERGWLLGFNTMPRAPNAVKDSSLNDLQTLLKESYPNTIGLATEVLDKLKSNNSCIEEYLFHEIICPHLGHEQTRTLQEMLFAKNYPRYLMDDKRAGHQDGVLSSVVKQVINEIGAEDTPDEYQYDSSSNGTIDDEPEKDIKENVSQDESQDEIMADIDEKLQAAASRIKNMERVDDPEEIRRVIHDKVRLRLLEAGGLIYEITDSEDRQFYQGQYRELAGHADAMLRDARNKFIRDTLEKAPRIYDKIAHARESLGFSQEKMSKKLGVGEVLYRSWEAGEGARPPQDILQKIERMAGFPQGTLSRPLRSLGAAAAGEGEDLKKPVIECLEHYSGTAARSAIYNWLKQHDPEDVDEAIASLASRNIIQAAAGDSFILGMAARRGDQKNEIYVDPIIRTMLHDLKNILTVGAYCDLILANVQNMEKESAEDDVASIEEFAGIFKRLREVTIGYFRKRHDLKEMIEALKDELPRFTFLADKIRSRVAAGGYKWDGGAGNNAGVLADYSRDSAIPMMQSTVNWLDHSMNKIDVGAVIAKSADAMKKSWPSAADIRFEITPLPEEARRLTEVFTYKLILKMALDELMRNAIKYSGTETITVSISVDQGELKVEVRDYGKGIKAQDLDKVFEPGFTEASSAHTGTGYGLPSLKEAIESVGGEMGVESEPGKGSAFTFTLPLNAPLDTVARPRLAQPLVLAIGGLKGSGRRVLAQSIASRIGLRYINGGFLVRILVYELLRTNKAGAGIDLNDEKSVTAFVEDLLRSGRIDYSQETVTFDGIDTEKPDTADGLALRDRIKAEIDRNRQNTELLHTVAAYEGVERGVTSFIKSLANTIKASGRYNGVVIRVTEPIDDKDVINIVLDAPPGIRAARTNKAPEWIEDLDAITNRRNIAGRYPDAYKLDTSVLSVREAGERIIEYVRSKVNSADGRDIAVNDSASAAAFIDGLVDKINAAKRAQNLPAVSLSDITLNPELHTYTFYDRILDRFFKQIAADFSNTGEFILYCRRILSTRGSHAVRAGMSGEDELVNMPLDLFSRIRKKDGAREATIGFYRKLLSFLVTNPEPYLDQIVRKKAGINDDVVSCLRKKGSPFFSINGLFLPARGQLPDEADPVSREDKLKADSVFKDDFVTLFEFNTRLFVLLAKRMKAKRLGDNNALAQAKLETQECLDALRAEMIRFDERIAKLPYELRGSKAIAKVSEQFAKAEDRIAKNNEPAANAALVGALNALAKAREEIVRTKTSSGWIRVNVFKENGKYIVRRNSYVRADDNARMLVRDKADQPFDLRWQAGRSFDEEEDGNLDERDKIAGYLDSIGKDLATARTNPSGLSSGAISSVISALSGVRVEETYLARLALEAARNLIELGEPGNVKEMLPIAQSNLKTRIEDIDRIMHHLKIGRIKPFRNIVTGDNAELLGFAKRIGSFIEKGDYKRALGNTYGLMKKTGPYLGEPELDGLRSMIGGIIGSLREVQTAPSAAQREAAEGKARFWVCLVKRKIDTSELLAGFMEAFRTEYAARRLAAQGLYMKEDTFINVFESFIKDKQLIRGSPEANALQMLCYLAVFIPMKVSNPLKVSEKIPSPIFGPINELRLAVDIDDIPTILKIARLNPLNQTLTKLEEFRSVRSISTLDKTQRTELLKSLAEDHDLGDDERFELAKAFAIDKKNLRRTYQLPADILSGEDMAIDINALDRTALANLQDSDLQLMQSYSGVRGRFGTAARISENAKAATVAYAYTFAANVIDRWQTADPKKEDFTFVIGRDPRPAGNILKRLHILGLLMAAGEKGVSIKITDLGVVSTPLMESAIRTSGYDAGVMITASHNPLEDNGFKYMTGAEEPENDPVNGKGSILNAAKMRGVIAGSNILLASISSGHLDFVERANVFARSNAGLINGISPSLRVRQNRRIAARGYIDFIGKGIFRSSGDELGRVRKRNEKTKVVVDPNGGGACGISADAIRYFGYQAIEINGRKGVPAHRIEPVKEALSDAAVKVRQSGAMLGIVEDFDADRGTKVVRDKQGNVRALEGQDEAYLNVAAIIAWIRTRMERYPEAQNKKWAIVTDGAASSRTWELCRKLGIDVFETDNGETNIVTGMHKLENEGFFVPIGIEAYNGGTILFGSEVRDGTLSALLYLLVNSDTAASEMLKRLTNTPAYHTIQEQRTTDMPTIDATAKKQIAGNFKRRIQDIPGKGFRVDGLGETVFARLEILTHEETDTFELADDVITGSGGFKILLTDTIGDRHFMWFRSSKTEPGILRLCADSKDAAMVSLLAKLQEALYTQDAGGYPSDHPARKMTRRPFLISFLIAAASGMLLPQLGCVSFDAGRRAIASQSAQAYIMGITHAHPKDIDEVGADLAEMDRYLTANRGLTDEQKDHFRHRFESMLKKNEWLIKRYRAHVQAIKKYLEDEATNIGIVGIEMTEEGLDQLYRRIEQPVNYEQALQYLGCEDFKQKADDMMLLYRAPLEYLKLSGDPAWKKIKKILPLDSEPLRQKEYEYGTAAEAFSRRFNARVKEIMDNKGSLEVAAVNKFSALCARSETRGFTTPSAKEIEAALHALKDPALRALARDIAGNSLQSSAMGRARDEHMVGVLRAANKDSNVLCIMGAFHSDGVTRRLKDEAGYALHYITEEGVITDRPPALELPDIPGDEDVFRMPVPLAPPSIFSDGAWKEKFRLAGEVGTLEEARKAVLSSEDELSYVRLLQAPAIGDLKVLVKTGNLEIGLVSAEDGWYLIKGLRGGVIIPFKNTLFKLHSHPKRIVKETGAAKDIYTLPGPEEEQRAKAGGRIEYVLSDKGLCAYGGALEKPVVAGWDELAAVDIPLTKLQAYFTGSSEVVRIQASATSDAQNIIHEYTKDGLRISYGTFKNIERAYTIIDQIARSGIDPNGKRVWDPGTGSGVLGLYAARQGANVVATDIQKTACDDAMYNVKKAQEKAPLKGSMEVRQGNLDECLKDNETFDLILAAIPTIDYNAPYQANPNTNDPGFIFMQGLLSCLQRRLNPGGRLILHYPNSQAAKISWASNERHSLRYFNIADRIPELEKQGLAVVEHKPLERYPTYAIWEVIKPATSVASEADVANGKAGGRRNGSAADLKAAKGVGLHEGTGVGLQPEPSPLSLETPKEKVNRLLSSYEKRDSSILPVPQSPAAEPEKSDAAQIFNAPAKQTIENTSPAPAGKPRADFEINPDERVIVDSVFEALGVDNSKLEWQPSGIFTVATVDVSALKEDGVRTVFDILEEAAAAGSVSIVNYDNVPVFLLFKNNAGRVNSVDLLRYYLSVDKVKAQSIKENVYSSFETGENTTPFRPYVYAIFDRNGNLQEIDGVAPQDRGSYGREELEKLQIYRIPVLPGVFEGAHPASYISAKAAEKLARPGMRVLIVGTGIGLEAAIAAKKGAAVDAMDCTEMAAKDTQMSLSIFGVDKGVHVFTSGDLFEGLGAYDLIVFNMPHLAYKIDMSRYPIVPSERNSTDFNGEVLNKVASTLADHLRRGAAAVIVNDKSPEVKKILEEKTGLPVKVDFSENSSNSQAYIITKENRENRDRHQSQSGKSDLGDLGDGPAVDLTPVTAPIPEVSPAKAAHNDQAGTGVGLHKGTDFGLQPEPSQNIPPAAALGSFGEEDLDKLREFNNRDFSFESLSRKTHALLEYSGPAAEMIHDFVRHAIKEMAGWSAKGEGWRYRVLGLAGEISGLYEVVVNRQGTLKSINLGRLQAIEKVISGHGYPVKEFDAVSENTVFEFKFHLTLRKLYQQVIGIDSAQRPHLLELIQNPDFQGVRNMVYFGEADYGYGAKALKEFIRNRPQIAPKVTLTDKGFSIRLALSEVRDFLGFKSTIDLTLHEQRYFKEKIDRRAFRREIRFMEKLIDRKLGQLKGEHFDVIIAMSNIAEKDRQDISRIIEKNDGAVPERNTPQTIAAPAITEEQFMRQEKRIFRDGGDGGKEMWDDMAENGEALNKEGNGLRDGSAAGLTPVPAPIPEVSPTNVTAEQGVPRLRQSTSAFGFGGQASGNVPEASFKDSGDGGKAMWDDMAEPAPAAVSRSVVISDSTVKITAPGGMSLFKISEFPDGGEDKKGVVLTRLIDGGNDVQESGLFVYAVPTGDVDNKPAIRGAYIARKMLGQGFLKPLLNIFFSRFPEAVRTDPSVMNCVLLDVLARDYGFEPEVKSEPNAWFRHKPGKNASEVFEIYFKDPETSILFGEEGGAVAARYEIINKDDVPAAELGSFRPVHLGIPLVLKDRVRFKKALETVRVLDIDRRLHELEKEIKPSQGAPAGNVPESSFEMRGPYVETLKRLNPNLHTEEGKDLERDNVAYSLRHIDLLEQLLSIKKQLPSNPQVLVLGPGMTTTREKAYSPQIIETLAILNGLNAEYTVIDRSRKILEAVQNGSVYEYNPKGDERRYLMEHPELEDSIKTALASVMQGVSASEMDWFGRYDANLKSQSIATFRGEFQNIEYGDAQTDIIVGVLSIVHALKKIPQKEMKWQFVSKLTRALKPGGYLLMSKDELWPLYRQSARDRILLSEDLTPEESLREIEVVLKQLEHQSQLAGVSIGLRVVLQGDILQIEKTKTNGVIIENEEKGEKGDGSAADLKPVPALVPEVAASKTDGTDGAISKPLSPAERSERDRKNWDLGGEDHSRDEAAPTVAPEELRGAAADDNDVRIDALYAELAGTTETKTLLKRITQLTAELSDGEVAALAQKLSRHAVDLHKQTKGRRGSDFIRSYEDAYHYSVIAYMLIKNKLPGSSALYKEIYDFHIKRQKEISSGILDRAREGAGIKATPAGRVPKAGAVKVAPKVTLSDTAAQETQSQEEKSASKARTLEMIKELQAKLDARKNQRDGSRVDLKPVPPAIPEVSPEVRSVDDILKETHELTAAVMKAHPLAENAKILLSESLFSLEDAAQLRRVLGPDSHIQIMAPQDVRNASTNNYTKKENVACVIGKNDYDDPELWNKNHKTQNKATMLILGEDLKGDRYLHVEGVVGMTRALMASDAAAAARFISMLFRKTDDMDAAALLDLLLKDPRAFADRIKFKPVNPADIEGLDKNNRIAVETYLSAA